MPRGGYPPGYMAIVRLLGSLVPSRTRRRCSALATLLALVGGGCGPTLGGEPGPGRGESSGDPPSGSTGAAVDGGSSTTAADSEGSSGAGSSSSTSTSGSSSGTAGDSDPTMCGCDPSIEVPYEEVVDGGYSAADIVALLESDQAGFEWIAFEDSPTQTTLHVQIAYAGGMISHGPEGDDGCPFFNAECPNTLRLGVVVSLSTDDGILAATHDAVVDVDLDGIYPGIELLGTIPIEAVEGTLPSLLPELEPTGVNVFLDWSLEGSLTDGHVVATDERGSALLGSVFE